MFFDLLATKESAKITQKDFKEAIYEFARSMVSHATELEKRSKVHIFSDCAFIEAPDSPKTHEYLKSLRAIFFDRGHYFKCSIVKGELGDSLTEADFAKPEDIKHLDLRVSIFEKDSVAAYILHEKFKGVGFVLDKDISGTLKEQSVRNYYLQGPNDKLVKGCLDIKYDESFLGKPIPNEADFKKSLKETMAGAPHEITKFVPSYYAIDQIIKDFSKAHTKSKSYSKYYLPIFVSIIRSSDFSKIDFDENWICTDFPYIFYILILNKDFIKIFRTVPYINYLFLTLIDEFYLQNGHVDHAFWIYISEFFAPRKKMVQEIGMVSDKVISPDAKEILLTHLSQNFASSLKGEIEKQRIKAEKEEEKEDSD